MVILLQINKIAFEKGENLEKKVTKIRNWLNFNRKLLFFLKKFFSCFFLNCSGGDI